MCNLHEKTLEKSPVDPPTNIQFDFSCNVCEETFPFDRPTNIYPYVLPWWPTPVPKINKPKVCQVKVLKQFEIILVQPQPQVQAVQLSSIDQAQSASDTTTSVHAGGLCGSWQ